MKEEPPYNPLDKRNLGVSVADAILERGIAPLPPSERFVGAGIYAIYYVGSFPPYAKIAQENSGNRFEWPIYVGKAVPAGARKGGLGLGLAPGNALFARLAEHAKSVDQARNLELEHFFCRYLVVDDIWIPLGEALLIEKFSPVWNKILDGYGNHTPGKGRYNQQVSAWDVIHPGRPWAARLSQNVRTQKELLKSVEDFTKTHP